MIKSFSNWDNACRFTTRSFGDEFGASIDGDIFKLQIAILLLLIYTTIMLSRYSEGCVGSRIILAFGGFISIGMAVAGALGIGSAFGLFYSPLMNVFPFLFIGKQTFMCEQTHFLAQYLVAMLI